MSSSLKEKTDKEKRKKNKLLELKRKVIVEEKLKKAMIELPAKPSIAEYLAYKHKRLYI